MFWHKLSKTEIALGSLVSHNSFQSCIANAYLSFALVTLWCGQTKNQGLTTLRAVRSKITLSLLKILFSVFLAHAFYLVNLFLLSLVHAQSWIFDFRVKGNLLSVKADYLASCIEVLELNILIQGKL
jgi:hypothetical protein